MKLADYAEQKLGIKEGTSTFNRLIDDYNNECRPSGSYRMTYNDSWCACFVSICLTHCGYSKNYNSVDCDELYSKMSKYHLTNRNNVKRNDIIFYSWKKTDADLQHVGIVTSRQGNIITVIEGNKSNAVSLRQINVYDSTIRHIVQLPDIKVDTSARPYCSCYDVTQVAKDVISGKYGNGAKRKQALESKGYNYTAVQKKVNELLKQVDTGAKPSYDVTQVAKDVIRGKYGNGAKRKQALESKGYNYTEVQKKVNELLKK